ncbi:hypothetical protein [Pseudogulbenkiania sp. MAI-1]|uniref:hypothetical protein n=1 Tax=Pseudogulbenkiania sp. MAI-1 TaxID=990370 RepID=UPI00045EB4BB|nr:hypothetical protein [Pseudogulbenkiania sp. MAI-1]
MREANRRLHTPDNSDRRPLAALASPIDPRAAEKLQAMHRRAVAVRREVEARADARREEH